MTKGTETFDTKRYFIFIETAQQQSGVPTEVWVPPLSDQTGRVLIGCGCQSDVENAAWSSQTTISIIPLKTL